MDSSAGLKGSCVNCLQKLEKPIKSQLLDFHKSPSPPITDELYLRSSNLCSFKDQKISSSEALEFMFQVSEHDSSLCQRCLEIFTPLFQCYVRFLSLSNDDSPVKEKWEHFGGRHISLNRMLSKFKIEDTAKLQSCQGRQLSVVLRKLPERTYNQAKADQHRQSTSSSDGEYQDSDSSNNTTADVEYLDPLENSEDDDDDVIMHDSPIALPVNKPTSSNMITPNVYTNSEVNRSSGLAEKYGRVKCPNCCEKYGSQFYLKKHMTVHSNSTKFWCKICCCGFEQRRNLVAHIHKEHADESCGDSSVKYRDLKCQRCSMKCLTPKTFVNHLITKHFICHHCSAEFTSLESVMEHLKQTHSASSELGVVAAVNEVSLICEQCGFVATSTRQLRNHSKCWHPTKLYPCQHCDKQFKTKHALDRHLISHSDERFFTCDQCSASYKFKKSLEEHKKMHEGGTVCDMCGFVSTSARGLRDHVKYIHQGVKRKDYHRFPAGNPARKRDETNTVRVENVAENSYLNSSMLKKKKGEISVQNQDAKATEGGDTNGKGPQQHQGDIKAVL